MDRQHFDRHGNGTMAKNVYSVMIQAFTTFSCSTFNSFKRVGRSAKLSVSRQPKQAKGREGRYSLDNPTYSTAKKPTDSKRQCLLSAHSRSRFFALAFEGGVVQTVSPPQLNLKVRSIA